MKQMLAMRVLMFIFFIIPPFSPSKANDSLKHRIISANFGLNYVHVQSDLISPLHYKGVRWPVGLEYYEITQQKYEILHINYSRGRLESNLTSPSSKNPHIDFLDAAIDFSHFRKVIHHRKHHLWFYLGGSWNSSFMYREHVLKNGKSYTPNSHTGGFSYLGLSSMIRFKMNQSMEIAFFLSYPLIGLKSYRYIESRFQPEFTSLFELIHLYQSIFYRVALSSRFDVFIKYQYTFFNYFKKEDIKIGHDFLFLGIGVHFYEKK